MTMTMNMNMILIVTIALSKPWRPPWSERGTASILYYIYITSGRWWSTVAAVSDIPISVRLRGADCWEVANDEFSGFWVGSLYLWVRITYLLLPIVYPTHLNYTIQPIYSSHS